MQEGTYKIVVGLGNPGDKYRNTRHNLGAEVVRAFGERRGLTFRAEKKFQSLVAQGSIHRGTGEVVKFILLLPQTYMNRSGIAVQKILDFFKISTCLPTDKLAKDEGKKENGSYYANLLAVVDDIYLKFGDFRFRPKGSSGGHNGLKSIDAALNKGDYSRLRLGVGPQRKSSDRLELDVPLEVYVLENFSKDENAHLSNFIEKAQMEIESWILEGFKNK